MTKTFSDDAAKRIAETVHRSEAERDREVPGPPKAAGRHVKEERRAKITAAGTTDGFYKAREQTRTHANAAWADHPTGMTWGIVAGDAGEIEEFTLLQGVVPGCVVPVQSVPTKDGRRVWKFAAVEAKFPVLVTVAGGEVGSESVKCSLTYNVFAEDGRQVLTAASPTNQRAELGRYKAATRGELEHRWVGGVLTPVLGWVNEEQEQNTGYDKAEAAAEPEVASPTAGGSGSQFKSGTLSFKGASDVSSGQAATLLPVMTHVEDEVAGDPAAETGKTIVSQWVPASSLPSGPNYPNSVEVAVVTDVRVDESTLKVQKKTRTVRVLSAGVESGWTDVHTGEECA
ncbi:MAG: hypothetical protein AAGC44_05165 [Planctomycetota bacterium]